MESVPMGSMSIGFVFELDLRMSIQVRYHYAILPPLVVCGAGEGRKGEHSHRQGPEGGPRHPQHTGHRSINHTITKKPKSYSCKAQG